jgi:hypothetical protein
VDPAALQRWHFVCSAREVRGPPSADKHTQSIASLFISSLSFNSFLLHALLLVRAVWLCLLTMAPKFKDGDVVFSVSSLPGA